MISNTRKVKTPKKRVFNNYLPNFKYFQPKENSVQIGFSRVFIPIQKMQEGMKEMMENLSTKMRVKRMGRYVVEKIQFQYPSFEERNIHPSIPSYEYYTLQRGCVPDYITRLGNNKASSDMINYEVLRLKFYIYHSIVRNMMHNNNGFFFISFGNTYPEAYVKLLKNKGEIKIQNCTRRILSKPKKMKQISHIFDCTLNYNQFPDWIPKGKAFMWNDKSSSRKRKIICAVIKCHFFYVIETNELSCFVWYVKKGQNIHPDENERKKNPYVFIK